MHPIVALLAIGAPILGAQNTDSLRADSAFRRQDWPAVAQLYGRIAERSPQQGMAWMRIGFAKHALGEIDPAIAAFEKARRAGEEGVMAKLASSRYRSGVRTRDWLKVKAHQEQEVVIVGFTAPRRSRKYFGALVLAVREDGGWAYVGRAGTGFDAARLRDIHALMVPLITDKRPVAAKVPDEAHTTWVKPKLVAEVKFTEWTTGGEMRHPVFLGLRTDKKASDVVRELPKRVW